MKRILIIFELVTLTPMLAFVIGPAARLNILYRGIGSERCKAPGADSGSGHLSGSNWNAVFTLYEMS